MSFSLFYSWQSDKKTSVNKVLIRDAIDIAVAELSVEVDEAPRVEADMENVSGSPEIATVLFQKIGRSAVFIADTTVVATTIGGRCLPNPNVSTEMGYAGGLIGWGRIICVMNEHFGGIKTIPFDVRNRPFPVLYKLNPDSMESSDRIRDELAVALRAKIAGVLETEYTAVSRAIERLDINSHSELQRFGRQKCFHSPQPLTQDHIFAVQRLLDLALVRADYAPQNQLYAYHWTYLGVEVLKRLAIRDPNEDNKDSVFPMNGNL